MYVFWITILDWKLIFDSTLIGYEALFIYFFFLLGKWNLIES